MSILHEQKNDSQGKHIAALRQKQLDVRDYSAGVLQEGHLFLADATLIVEGCEAKCGLLTRVTKSSSLGTFSYEPTIFIGTQSVSREHKLELGFVGWILGKLQDKFPEHG